jgi:hypothetical protein
LQIEDLKRNKDRTGEEENGIVGRGVSFFCEKVQALLTDAKQKPPKLTGDVATQNGRSREILVVGSLSTYIINSQNS